MAKCLSGTSSGCVPQEFPSEPSAADETQWANRVLGALQPACIKPDPACRERTVYEIYKVKRPDGTVHALLCYRRWCEPVPDGRETAAKPECEPAGWQSSVADRYVPGADWEQAFIDAFDAVRTRAWMACTKPCRTVWQTFHMDTGGEAGDAGTRRVFIIGHWRCERAR